MPSEPATTNREKKQESPSRPTEPTWRCYTIRQAAEGLGLGERTVRRMVERGALRVLRVGRSVRIPAEELRRITTDPQSHSIHDHGGREGGPPCQ